MKVNLQPNIITDPTVFADRVDEINSSVSYDTIKHCVSKLKKVLYANPDYPAICAPQIGDNLRLFVVRTAKGEAERFKVFLNPMIISSDGLHMSRESNISFPNKQFLIPRKNKLHVAYQAIDGQVASESYAGAYAEVIQQMIEMLDGITIMDYGLDLDDVGGPDAFDSATKKSKTELIALYLDSIKSLSADLATEIENTPELKYLNDVIDFNTGVLKGDITIITKSTEETEKSDAV